MSIVFEWLVKASRCGDPEIEKAAEVMKDYYQGASPKMSAAEREQQEKFARRLSRQHNAEEND